MAHECTEFCSTQVTPATLIAAGFPTRVEHVETSMGTKRVTVIHEGMPYPEAVAKAIAAGVVRFCAGKWGARPRKPLPQASPGMLEWALSVRVTEAPR